VPFVIRDSVPHVAATVDGIGGDFNIDTGDSGGISLFQPFLRRTGLSVGTVLSVRLLRAGTPLDIALTLADRV
jgi:hypothetical protein